MDNGASICPNICYPIVNLVNIILSASNTTLDAMQKMKHILERSAFGVCNYLGNKMGIASARVRVYFIYLSFATLGSPVILYLFVAFWLNVRNYIRRSRSVIWR
jgi:phage shock protein PspC (stress-responsive transcriptional regulator)